MDFGGSFIHFFCDSSYDQDNVLFLPFSCVLFCQNLLVNQIWAPFSPKARSPVSKLLLFLPLVPPGHRNKITHINLFNSMKIKLIFNSMRKKGISRKWCKFLAEKGGHAYVYKDGKNGYLAFELCHSFLEPSPYNCNVQHFFHNGFFYVIIMSLFCSHLGYSTKWKLTKSKIVDLLCPYGHFSSSVIVFVMMASQTWNGLNLPPDTNKFHWIRVYKIKGN